MNWVGGARSRVRIKQEKRKQREFFEKKKQERRVKRSHPLGFPNDGSMANKKISQDLLSLRTIIKTHDQHTKRKKHADTDAQRVPVYVNLDIATPGKVTHIHSLGISSPIRKESKLYLSSLNENEQNASKHGVRQETKIHHRKSDSKLTHQNLKHDDQEVMPSNQQNKKFAMNNHVLQDIDEKCQNTMSLERSFPYTLKPQSADDGTIRVMSKGLHETSSDFSSKHGQQGIISRFKYCLENTSSQMNTCASEVSQSERYGELTQSKHEHETMSKEREFQMNRFTRPKPVRFDSLSVQKHAKDMFPYYSLDDQRYTGNTEKYLISPSTFKASINGIGNIGDGESVELRKDPFHQHESSLTNSVTVNCTKNSPGNDKSIKAKYITHLDTAELMTLVREDTKDNCKKVKSPQYDNNYEYRLSSKEIKKGCNLFVSSCCEDRNKQISRPEFTSNQQDINSWFRITTKHTKNTPQYSQMIDSNVTFPHSEQGTVGNNQNLPHVDQNKTRNTQRAINLKRFLPEPVSPSSPEDFRKQFGVYERSSIPLIDKNDISQDCVFLNQLIATQEIENSQQQKSNSSLQAELKSKQVPPRTTLSTLSPNGTLGQANISQGSEERTPTNRDLIEEGCASTVVTLKNPNSGLSHDVHEAVSEFLDLEDMSIENISGTSEWSASSSENPLSSEGGGRCVLESMTSDVWQPTEGQQPPEFTQSNDDTRSQLKDKPDNGPEMHFQTPVIKKEKTTLRYDRKASSDGILLQLLRDHMHKSNVETEMCLPRPSADDNRTKEDYFPWNNNSQSVIRRSSSMNDIRDRSPSLQVVYDSDRLVAKNIKPRLYNVSFNKGDITDVSENTFNVHSTINLRKGNLHQMTSCANKAVQTTNDACVCRRLRLQDVATQTYNSEF